MNVTLSFGIFQLEINNEMDYIPCFPDLIFALRIDLDHPCYVFTSVTPNKTLLALGCGGFPDGDDSYSFLTKRGEAHFVFLTQGYLHCDPDPQTKYPAWVYFCEEDFPW